MERFMNLQDKKTVVTRSGLIFETVLPPHILQCFVILIKFGSEALWRFKNSQVSSVFQGLHDRKHEDIKISLPTTFLLRKKCKIYIHAIVWHLNNNKTGTGFLRGYNEAPKPHCLQKYRTLSKLWWDLTLAAVSGSPL